MRSNIKKLVWASLLTAIILLATAILRIPIGIGGVYIHLGDSIVIFTGALLGGPFGAVAAVIGSSLADFLTGASVYIPATVVIKGIMGFIAGVMLYSSREKSLFLCAITAFICECVMVVGYFAFNFFMYGFAAAIGYVPWDLIQLAAGIIGAVVLIRTIKLPGMNERA